MRPFILPATLAMLVVQGIGHAQSDVQQPSTRPNLAIDVSAAVIKAAVGQAIDRTESVQEVIQETPVHGIGRTRGRVSAELIPDDTQASIDVGFQGRIHSHTVGTRPHALIYTVTRTDLDVRRRVIVDGAGLRTIPGPAYGASVTDLLDTTNRSGDRNAPAADFARWGFLRSQADAEYETTWKSANRVSQRVAEELAPAFASIRDVVQNGLQRMKQSKMSLESLRFTTSASFLHARLRVGASAKEQPGVVLGPPPGIDVGLRVHQTLVNEAARRVYGGQSFVVTKASAFYEDVTRGLLRDARKESEQREALKTLEKLLADLGGKPTTITLAKDDPILVTFGDHGFTIMIHVSSVREDNKTYTGFRIRADYRLENAEAGVYLIRKGSVRFLPYDESTLKKEKREPLPQTFVLIQELVFAEVLKARLVLTAVPAVDSFESLRFLPPRAGAHDGWVGVFWNLQAPEKKAR